MSPDVSHEELLRRLLTLESVSDDPIGGDHPDEDTLALWIEGGLSVAEREEVNRHLAACAVCREIAAVSLTALAEPALATNESAQTVSPVTQIQRSAVQRQWLARLTLAAAAAVVLISVGLWWRQSGPRQLADAPTYARVERLLAQSDFAQARSALAEAERLGIHSDRLTNLESQAVRELPGELALASVGRLTDFGFDVDGTIARGAAPQTGLSTARELLGKITAADLNALLNRGHAALSAGDLVAARVSFEEATLRAPHSEWSWLGLGLTEFANQRLPEAEAAFKRCLTENAGNVAARIDLAMTVQEAGREPEAKALWEALEREPLKESDQRLVRRALEYLREP